MKTTFNIKDYSNKKILFAFALESEAADLFDGNRIIFSGIGKVNATLTLTRAIEQEKPDLIINLGTAGSNIFKKHSVINCTEFIQRDMNVTGLGFELYQTPLTNVPAILNYGLEFPNAIKGICGTGDSFETNLKDKPYNLVDMEAYAFALVAKNYDIPFLCLKFISDGADDDAPDSWIENILHSAEVLHKTLFK